jgi:peptide methionine sulfoxide reductase MsrB
MELRVEDRGQDLQLQPPLRRVRRVLGGHQLSRRGGSREGDYDSVSGKPLFIAPRGRSFEDFQKESKSHGWPSFRDEEVVWENVRCLKDGEAISVDGTHLGHNLPDKTGNRYCINLVSVAGRPM